MEDDEFLDDFDSEFGAERPDPSLAAQPPKGRGFDGEIGALQQDMASAAKRRSELRQQQLQRATQALQQRRMGPSMAEQLFALSAAFAAPQQTRGFSGMMSNVMPVLGQMTAAQRQGKQTREDALLELQNAYQTGELDDMDTSISQRLQMLKLQREANKPVRGVISPVTGKVMNPYDGSVIVPGTEDLPRVYTKEDMLKLAPGERYVAPDGSIRQRGGGGTGDGAGGFRP